MGNLWMCVVLVGLATACGGSGTDVDYLALPPQEAADQVTATVCDQVFACGVVSFDTSADPWTAHYEPAATIYPTLMACTDELSPGYVEMFAGCAMAGLTSSERADVNACLTADAACLSQAELDAEALALQRGEPFGSDACKRASTVFERCKTCFELPDDPSCASS